MWTDVSSSLSEKTSKFNHLQIWLKARLVVLVILHLNVVYCLYMSRWASGWRVGEVTLDKLTFSHFERSESYQLLIQRKRPSCLTLTITRFNKETAAHGFKNKSSLSCYTVINFIFRIGFPRDTTCITFVFSSFVFTWKLRQFLVRLILKYGCSTPSP